MENKYKVLIKPEASGIYILKGEENKFETRYKDCLYWKKLLGQTISRNHFEVKWENSEGKIGTAFNDVALYEESIDEFDAWLVAVPNNWKSVIVETGIEGMLHESYYLDSIVSYLEEHYQLPVRK